MKIEKLLAEKSITQVERILPTATLQETACKLIDLRIGALVVCDEADQLMGIISERDLLPVIANIDALPSVTKVADVMTQNVISCQSDDEIAHILQLMNANSIRHIPVMDGKRLVDMVSIRQLTKAYELLQKEADTDPLTELSNRRPFLRRLEVEYARARRFKHHLTVGMIDIDHFKTVNDTYGHDAGDQVLRAVSAMLINHIRSIDLVGRLGGEEFAIIFPETDVKGAKVVCNRLLKAMEASIIPVAGQQICVTASIGLTDLSSTARTGADILKQADALLYEAKRGGRNRIAIAA